MFIKRYNSGGYEYARLLKAQRAKGGRRHDELVYHLGRVVDYENGVYRNKERGIYRYVLGEGFKDVEDPSKYLELFYGSKLELILDFGPEYVFIEALKKDGFFNVLSSVTTGNKDTLLSLVLHKMLWKDSNLYAQDFWRTSYCRIAFPNAKLASQRVSEFLESVGDEVLVRNFFSVYLAHIREKTGNSSHSILIDSTGLPNDYGHHRKKRTQWSGKQRSQTDTRNGQKVRVSSLLPVCKRHDC